jgi:hypothetical protein
MSLNPRGTLRSAAAAGVVGILLFPAMLAIACPPLPPRAGAEIVNPYVLARAYDATSSGFEAFERVGIPANDSLQELGQPALAFDRVALESSDDSRWVTDLAILEGLFDTQVYRFVVNPSDVNASNLVFSWEGFGEFQPGPQTYLMAFNHTRGGWDNLTHYGFTTPVDRVLTGEISGSVSDYILNNTVTLLVASVKGRIKSSCPMLFAWNGSAYGFVTDFLGDGIIGMPVLANLIRFPADPTEYLMVGPQRARDVLPAVAGLRNARLFGRAPPCRGVGRPRQRCAAADQRA